MRGRENFFSKKFPLPRGLLSFPFKPMYEPRGVGGADIAADDAVAIDEDVCVDGTVIVGIIGDGKGIACDVLSFIFGKIQPLGFLDLVIGGEDLIEFRGDGDGLGLDGGRIDGPAELREEVGGVLGSFDLFIIDADLTVSVGGDEAARIGGYERDEGDEDGQRHADDAHEFDGTGTQRIDKHKKRLRDHVLWYTI